MIPDPALLPSTYSAELTETAIGDVTVQTTDTAVCRVELRGRSLNHTPKEERPSILEQALHQLRAYFSGDLTEFSLPLALLPSTTGFQRSVYRQLARVRFGEVTTYGRLAEEIGRPGSARAVGQAVGANPLPLVIPCHRVVGSGGRLTGFGSGIPNKVLLLGLEGVGVTGQSPNSRVQRFHA